MLAREGVATNGCLGLGLDSGLRAIEMLLYLHLYIWQILSRELIDMTDQGLGEHSTDATRNTIKNNSEAIGRQHDSARAFSKSRS